MQNWNFPRAIHVRERPHTGAGMPAAGLPEKCPAMKPAYQTTLTPTATGM